MADPKGAAPSWAWLNVLLCALVAVVLVCLILVVVKGVSVIPGTTKAERTQQGYADVHRAAAKEVTAFLEVDYKKMDPLIAKVLAGATGTFEKQYAATKANLKSAAVSANATSTGSVKQIGVTSLKGNSATVFVAADAVVSNKSSVAIKSSTACPHAGAVCRYYRLKLGMVRTGGTWKMSSLDFVS